MKARSGNNKFSIECKSYWALKIIFKCNSQQL